MGFLGDVVALPFVIIEDVSGAIADVLEEL